MLQRTLLSSLIILILTFAGCGGGASSAHEEICSADCLGKIRPKAQACGEDQACKQAAMAELKECEDKCKNYE